MTAIFAGTVCAAFRERTEAQTMLGVTSIPSLKVCQRCGKLRTAKTGSHNKAGKFICGQCRPVFARIADKTVATS